MIEFTPLTAENYNAVCGAPLQRSVRGFAVVEGGRAVWVVGMYADEERHILWSQCTEEFRERLGTFGGRRAVAMAGRLAQAMMKAVRGPVDATPAEEYSHTVELLERLGFVRQAPSVYRYLRPQEGGLIWRN